MIKITNPLGDVKIGRQGEVVYQRKYGEQIRRQASPKRAIASEAQIAHRQLYRDALDWRKQLSLPNRRYLEGYSYANRIVDSYHIPLPWSRFALKLYLQSVKFVGKLETTSIEGQAGDKKDYSPLDHYGRSNFGMQYWLAQTFEPLEPYTIGKVVLALSTNDSPHTIYVGLRLTDGEGKPTGADLVTAQTNGDTLPASPTVEHREIDMPAYDLQQGVLYAIVWRAPEGSGLNCVKASYNHYDSAYPRGKGLLSSNSGDTWAWRTRDWNFEVWSAEIAEQQKKQGLIHVRHPALMSVVHKRGALTITQYDTLSSLDDEYLTGQVGLDVEAGDTIEATTLPGINYHHRVS